MKNTPTLALIALIGLAAGSHAQLASSDEINWLTGENAQLFGISPNIHLLGSTGLSSSPAFEDLSGGHHDPSHDYSLQALELSLSAHWGEYLKAQFNHAYFTEYEDSNTELHHETEELFLKLANLPGGFETRGGMFLNRFGFQNAQHNHAWDFVNQNLSNSAILMEGELTTIGGELAWNLPTEFPAAITFYAGDAPEHEEHEHEGPEPLYEGHDGELDEDIFGIHLMITHNLSDFHQFAATLSVTHGQNHFETETSLAGAGLQYMWRENGLEPGGRALTLRGELAYRSFEAINEDDAAIRDDIKQIGGYFSQIYEHNSRWSFANRFGYVTGNDDAELTERFRISQAVTWHPEEHRNLFTRVQLDNDWIEGFGNHETSVWIQFGLHWGPGNEVR